MKQRAIAVLLGLVSLCLCACGGQNECTCACDCDACSCSQKADAAPESDLASYASGVEYTGQLRKEGVFIGSVSEDGATMRVGHRGGVWVMDCVEGVNVYDTVWAVIADSGTPDDFTDDVFVAFLPEE